MSSSAIYYYMYLLEVVKFLFMYKYCRLSIYMNRLQCALVGGSYPLGLGCKLMVHCVAVIGNHLEMICCNNTVEVQIKVMYTLFVQ